MSVKIRFTWAALFTLLPLIWLLVAAQDQPVVERAIATHWTLAGVPDGYDNQNGLLWAALIPLIACTLIAGALVIALDQSVGRWSAASGFGTLALVSAGAVLMRGAMLATALQPELGDRLGSPFLTLLWAIPWGAIAFWIASARRPIMPEPQEVLPESAD
ncbi:hypothetical protein D9V34_11035 [Mycetocola lacteus]|uniref:DUF1648 domain-containing protein n=1 Tax=Mycetocola lacteus TaxID=76637 RepID=A0A3L7APG0_9MICO|nr:hypothetical protein [Mycetocola lacteus]RLP82316.1 hypothetical protein D9V34_11035 [Mycetocola lacteus]